jgi:thiol:disulfide interchange protein
MRTRTPKLAAICTLLVLCALALAPTLAPALHAEPVKAAHLTVDLIARDNALVPGEPSQLGLYFRLDPGWHVYWINAGDSGEPPDMKWHLPDGITAGDMQFPAPRRLPLGPLMDFGYEDSVMFPVPLTVASSVRPGTRAALSADVRWLVCREVCIPGKATLSLELPVATSTARNMTSAPVFALTATQLPKPLPAGDTASVSFTNNSFNLTLQTAHRESSAEFFPFHAEQIANAAPQVVTPLDDGVQLTIRKDDNLRANPAPLVGVITLSGGRSYTISAGGTSAPPPVAASTSTAGLGRIIALAFLGGIILNLMPCVFPVLFIKGLAMLNTHGAARSHARAHGAVYALGILVSFWFIAGALLALRAGGHHLGWGFQYQSPQFVVCVAALLFFLALSLAGQFDIGLSLTSAGGSFAQREGFAGSFFTGVLATIVATPCTAPFMGAAIGFALSQSAIVSLAVFTALALGLAAPYVLLTIYPEWLRIFPKPGAWMETLKQLFSIPIFATVIWLVWVYSQQAGSTGVALLLACFLLLAVAGWVIARRRRGFAIIATILIIVALAIPIRALHSGPATTQWQPWSPAALDQARATGRPVFVDFTAAWCLSCQFNERTVLESDAVRQKLAQTHVILLRADWTHYDPDITAALTSFGRSGVPAYVIYSQPPPAQPDVLPEALTRTIVLNALDRIATQQGSQPSKTP